MIILNIYDALDALSKALALAIILIAAVSVAYLICRCALFKKMGIAWWKALIPFYSNYVEFATVWETKYFWLWLALFLVNVVIPLPVILAKIIALALFAVGCVETYMLCKAFEKDVPYVIGMILLPFIFYPLLSLGYAQYVGNRSSGGGARTNENRYDDLY